MSKTESADNAPSKQLTDDELAEFMTRGRSAREVAEKFSMSVEEARAKLEKGFEGYDLFGGPKNIRGEETFVAVPACGDFKVRERAWGWRQHRWPDDSAEAKRGEKPFPYGVVNIKDDFTHRKVQIVPLDGIFYGDDDHDAVRFDAVLKYIARTPNAFCFLNGDAFGEIKGGGKKEEREQLLLNRAVEFKKRVQPIAHKILWAQRGCVEMKCLAQQGFDPLEYVCGEEIPYFDQPVYIDIFWGKQLFTLWAMHGQSTAQVKGARINMLCWPAQIHDFTNFIIRGHIGDAIWNRQIKVCRDSVAGRLAGKEEFLMVLGNFKKYFGTKAAWRGETPRSNETIVLYLYPDGNCHVKTKHDGSKRP